MFAVIYGAIIKCKYSLKWVNRTCKSTVLVKKIDLLNMSQRASSAEVVDPAVLSGEQKSTFIDNLYDLHQQIFDGVDRDSFIDYVVDSPAEWTRICIYKNSQNDWVGYCAVHRFRKQVAKRKLVVFRAEAGILREYRGRSMTLWFGFGEAIKYHLRHPFKSIYYLGSFVHPAVLYMFSRYIHEFYPRPGVAIPAKIKRLMLKLAEIFHLESIEDQHELVRSIGWITIEPKADRDFWQHHQNPTVKFYIGTNPDYVNGNGLLTLMPLTFSNIFLSLFRFLIAKLKRTIRRY